MPGEEGPRGPFGIDGCNGTDGTMGTPGYPGSPGYYCSHRKMLTFNLKTAKTRPISKQEVVVCPVTAEEQEHAEILVKVESIQKEPKVVFVNLNLFSKQNDFSC